jgi:hypothetical protein
MTRVLVLAAVLCCAIVWSIELYARDLANRYHAPSSVYVVGR